MGVAGGARRRLDVVLSLALAVIATATPFLLGELVLRWMAPPRDTPNLFVPVPDSDVEYRGRPSASGLFAGAEVRLNALGLRDPERAPERTPGVARIIVLGDSVTFGQGVAESLTYPRLVEARLNAAHLPGHTAVEVMNFGVPGYNTLQELAQLRELGLRFHPDVVVVGFLYNDVLLTARERARLAAGAAAAAQGAAASGQGVRSWINGAITILKRESLVFAYLSPRVGAVVRKLGWKAFGQTGDFKDQFTEESRGWLSVREALLALAAAGEESGFELVVMIIPAMLNCIGDAYPIREYHEAVSGFCAQRGIRSLDLLPAFRGIDASRFWITATDGHPNAEGHRLIGEALARYLLPLLGGEAATN